MSFMYTFVKKFQVSKLCSDCLNPNSLNYQPFPHLFYIHVVFILSLNQEHYCSRTKMTFLADKHYGKGRTHKYNTGLFKEKMRPTYLPTYCLPS